MKHKLVFLSIVLLVSAIFSPSVGHAAGTNLIQNPSLETVNPTNPALPNLWTTGGFGTNDRTFTYPVAGVDGANAARVDITTYVNGDGKWIFNDVPVTAGQQYSFQDSYMATVPTALAIQYTNASGAATFDSSFPTVPASPDNWATANVSFTPPAGTVSVTVFHLLNAVGSLTVDNYSLVLIPPPTPFTQGFVSLTFDDGSKTQFNNAKPILDIAGMKGTFYIITHVSAGFTQFTTPESVLPDTIYNYTDQYTSNSASVISAQVTLRDGTVTNAEVVDNNGITVGTDVTLPASPTTSLAQVSFYIPADAKTVTVSHTLINSGGSLNVSNALFGGATNMTIQDALSLQASGHEIGAHTQTHSDLTLLSASDAQTEISGSRNDLLANGILSVTSIAYPYGNANASTMQIAQSAGLTSGRSVTPGFNGTDANHFALLTQSVNADTTLSQVQAWIDSAMANKTWLILVFHDIIPDTTNDPFGSTPTMLQNITSYLKTKNVPVRTMNEGMALMSGTTPTPTPTSTPATTINMSLKTGWNLITLPIQPTSTLTAESFGQLAGADVVTQWLNTQQYNSHIVGVPVNNFDINIGMGFFVHVTSSKNISITGTPMSQPVPTLTTGWNLLGWTKNTDTNADAFGLSFSSSDVVSIFNSATQQWNSHIVNLPINNFTITQGDGVFVHRP